MNNGVLWEVKPCSNLAEELAACIRRKDDGGSNNVSKFVMLLSECTVSRLRKDNLHTHWCFFQIDLFFHSNATFPYKRPIFIQQSNFD